MSNTANDLEDHQCIFVGGILQCAHHSIDQMLTHESDIMAEMIGEAETIHEVKEPSIRKYLDICLQIIKEKKRTIATYLANLKDMYEKDPGEILLEIFDNKEWNRVVRLFDVQFQFENIRSTDTPTDRLPIKEQVIPVYLNTEIPLPGIQQYFLKSISGADPAGYVKRLDSVSQYMLLSLVIFEFKNGVSRKIYPSHLNIHTLLNMTFGTLTMGKISYRLRGMIVHQGSGIGSGHYYYVLLDDKLRQWAYDDQIGKVVQKNFESFTAKECPYMLLYKRV